VLDIDCRMLAGMKKYPGAVFAHCPGVHQVLIRSAGKSLVKGDVEGTRGAGAEKRAD